MSASTSVRTNDFRKIVSFLMVLLASIALPTGITAGALYLTLLTKPLGYPSNESRNHYGALKNGELWFTVETNIEIEPNSIFGVQLSPKRKLESRIKRLDLTSGVEIDTGLAEGGSLVRSKDDLYLAGWDNDYRMVGSSLEQLPKFPSRTYSPFLYDGHFTRVISTKDGHYRLVSLIEGKWVDGPSIILPGANQ